MDGSFGDGTIRLTVGSSVGIGLKGHDGFKPSQIWNNPHGLVEEPE
jgi:hypothetical protein